MSMHAISNRATAAFPVGGSYVFFERGTARFCAPVDDVQAIEEIRDVRALPFLRKGIAGVFMFRGRMALLCDPGAALAAAGDSAATSLAIVVAFPEGTVAFRVDRVSEIVPAAGLERPAGELNALAEWMDGYAMQGANIAFLTTFDKLMRLFTGVDRAAGLAALMHSATASANDPVASASPAAPVVRPPPVQSGPKEEAAPPPVPALTPVPVLAPKPATPRPPAPVRSAPRPVRAPAVRPRIAPRLPVRPPPLSTPVPEVEVPVEEPKELQPEPRAVVEPRPVEVREEPKPAPIRVSAPTTLQVPTPLPEPAVPAPAPVHSAPIPTNHAEPVERPSRFVFIAAGAASVLFALGAASLLLVDFGSTKPRPALVAAAPTSPPAPSPLPSSETPAPIAIVGKDFELRVERGAAAAPAPWAPAGEIRHIVVRGDTLWAIATRYLGDPWRYPELAHDSRIRNPDLIYPGDVVVIVRRR